MSIKQIKKVSISLGATMLIVLLSSPILYAETREQWDLEKEMESSLKAAAEKQVVTAESEEEDVQSEIDSSVIVLPSRRVEDQSGKVGIIQSDTEYSYEFKVLDALPVKLSLDHNYISIDNSTEVELPAHLVGLGFDMETTLPFFNYKNTYLRIGVNPSYYSDGWNFRSTAFRIPSRYYLIYRPDERWTFVGGLYVACDFETPVFPILGFVYKPNDRLTFNIVPDRPNITYSLNDKIDLFAEGGRAVNSEFEVAKDDIKNTKLIYNQAHLGGGIKYNFNKYIQTSVTVGGVFNRTIKYQDSLGKVNIKNGLYSEFRIEMEI